MTTHIARPKEFETAQFQQGRESEFMKWLEVNHQNGWLLSLHRTLPRRVAVMTRGGPPTRIDYGDWAVLVPTIDDADGIILLSDAQFRERYADTVLDGSSEIGEMNAWPANAGEFAARWNALPPAEREERCHIIRESLMTSVAIAEGIWRPRKPSHDDLVSMRTSEEREARALEAEYERMYFGGKSITEIIAWHDRNKRTLEQMIGTPNSLAKHEEEYADVVTWMGETVHRVRTDVHDSPEPYQSRAEIVDQAITDTLGPFGVGKSSPLGQAVVKMAEEDKL